MEFFEANQICGWAESHGLACGERLEVRLPKLPVTYRAQYAHGRRSGTESRTAHELSTRLGSWSECLVSVTSWGVWPSSEDWPKFYAWRAARGEKRSLDVVSGHLFSGGEGGLLQEFLALVMENAWDAQVLPACSGKAGEIVATISHDDWFEILGTHGSAG